MELVFLLFFVFFQAEDGIRDDLVTGVQTCALPISGRDVLARRDVLAAWDVLAGGRRHVAVDGGHGSLLTRPVFADPVVPGPVVPRPVVPRRRPGQLQRGPLVFGHHRSGVDGGGCVVSRRGGYLLVGRRGRGRVAVGQRPDRGQVAVLVLPGGFGPGDELHVGAQVVAADLDDVVGLLAERAGNGPVPVHRNVYQGDPHAQVLDVGDDLGQVLFRADQ